MLVVMPEDDVALSVWLFLNAMFDPAVNSYTTNDVHSFTAPFDWGQEQEAKVVQQLIELFSLATL